MIKRPLQGIREMNTLFLAAEEEARLAGDPRPGAEHLVLAALSLSEGSARRAFERIGADPDALRDVLALQHERDLGAVGVRVEESAATNEMTEAPGNRRPFTTAPPSPAANKVFKQAAKLVMKEKAPFYGAYIVMVAAGIEQGTTARALRSMGVDLAALADATRAEIDALEASDD